MSKVRIFYLLVCFHRNQLHNNQNTEQGLVRSPFPSLHHFGRSSLSVRRKRHCSPVARIRGQVNCLFELTSSPLTSLLSSISKSTGTRMPGSTELQSACSRSLWSTDLQHRGQKQRSRVLPRVGNDLVSLLVTYAVLDLKTYEMIEKNISRQTCFKQT